MNRIQRAMQFARKEMMYRYPQLADKEFRVKWWKEADRIERMMFIQEMTILADYDLSIIEEAKVVG